MKKICTYIALFIAILVTTSGWKFDRQAPRGPSLLSAPQPALNLDRSPAARHQENLLNRRSYQLSRFADPRTGRIPPDIHRLEREFAAGLPRREPSDKSFSWSFGGPDNVGGRTRTLAVDVGDPSFSTLLAGGVSGGMWRSEDDGLTWNLTTGSSQVHHVSSLAQDTRPGQRNIWYYGTGEGEGGSASWPSNEYYVHPGDGIYKSTDGGRSWAVLPATAGADPQEFTSPWQVVWRLSIDTSATGNGEVYAATWGGIYRSTDGGATWSHVLGDLNTPAGYADLTVSPTGVVYATLSYDGAQHGAFRSTDGVNWTDITPPGYSDYDRIVLAMAPTDENVVWVLVANTFGHADAALFRYQYLSGNGSGAGGWWQDRSSQLASLPGTYGAAHYETQGSYCQMIAVNPADSETVYLGGVYLYRSTDGFQQASNTTLIGGWDYPDHHADLHWLIFRPGSSSRAYSGSDGGVHRTLDVGAFSVGWTSLNNGYNTSQFYTVAIDEGLTGSPVVIGGTQDNGSLFNSNTLPAANWVESLAGDGGFCAVANTDGAIGTYYMSYQQNYGVFRMLLDNVSGALQSRTRVDPPGADTSLWLKPYLLAPSNPQLMYLAADDALWRNNNLAGIPEGNSGPTSINWDILTQAPSGQIISALAVSRSPAHSLYFGTAAGQLYRLDAASTAMPGSSPTRLDVGADFPPGGYLSSIAVHPGDDQRVLVAFSNYNVINLFSSTNGGLSWDAVEGNLGGTNSPSVRTVAWLPAAGADNCLAATSTGIYSTTALNGDATVWQREAADEVGNAVVDMLAVRPVDGLVVAGTHGKGIVRGTFSASAVVGDQLPQQLHLAQNVPNPFNPTTTINFEIPRDGRVTIMVFDVAGRRVRRLLDEERTAGKYGVVWDGTDASSRPVGSGTYLYRIRSAGQVDTKSMVLVR